MSFSVEAEAIGPERSAVFVDGGELDVLPALVVDQLAGQIRRMPAGHHHDAGRSGLEARIGDVVEPLPDLLARRFRFSFDPVLHRIVYDEQPGDSAARERSTDSGCYQPPAVGGQPLVEAVRVGGEIDSAGDR